MNGDSGQSMLRAAVRTVIVSHVRFLSESLMETLSRDRRFKILSYCATTPQALDVVIGSKPDVVLLDAAFSDGRSAVVQIRAMSPWVRVIVLAVNETEDNVVAWAKVGVTGYIPDATPLSDVGDLLAGITEGRQACSRDVAGGLLRRVGYSEDVPTGFALPPSLTDREREILRLIGVGLSNKDIARRLNISLATTKAHVHNLLGKLNVRRRGEATAWMHARSKGLDAPPPHHRAADPGAGQDTIRLEPLARK
jgi:two-component system nitrate/nitrite response regulator NarL